MSGSDRRAAEDATTDRIDSSAGAGLSLLAMWNGGSLAVPLPRRGTLVLGRGSDVQVKIDHGSVSRRHVMLVIDEGMLRIDDLGSSNGTFVDGRRIEPRGSAALRPGALVEIGSALVVVREGRGSVPPQVKNAPLVVEDPEMAKLHELVGVVAKSTLSVVLLGETGAGKEVVATRVHQLSARADKPFSKVNCAALVETLLEAELFGYEKGAFTGATQSKPGLLESAHGGTLFLDEVGEMPLATQAKLLRVLESGEVMRVGALKPRPIDVRFVSATNRDLRDFVSSAKFRQDLFFRLDGISISIPPLRERRAEIPGLAHTFLKGAAEAAGRRPMTISNEAMSVLLGYPWPGNVRELRNVLMRSTLLAKTDTLMPDDLRFEGLGLGTTTPPPPMTVLGGQNPYRTVPPPVLVSADEAERRRIAEALERSVGNQTRAAKLLGISRRTLLKRLDSLGFPRPRKRDGEESDED
ncbi:sigma 54-interacting transcriptional regulator [Labilithrix luteola]|uniref:sigma 54-interacting transcriptional regulator n=1 Tax=Labilithrix luteola TaxID=1391654 RepID=UPI0011BA4D9F|nr:sigma 54-interacting transcriptional regulator [Labilithrix luteola]